LSEASIFLSIKKHMAYRKKKYYRRQNTKPRKRYYKKKGKQLYGYELTRLIYPYLIFISITFWIVTGILLYGIFNNSGVIQALLTLMTIIFGTGAVFVTYKWHRTKQLLNQSRTLAQLRRMNPYDFEHYVANLFCKLGFKAEATKSSGDFGVDVVAYKGGKKYVVQCKRHAAHVKDDSPALQQFIGSMEIYKSKHGIFVNTSGYTPAARKLAKKHNIYLVDETELMKLVRRAFPKQKSL